MTRQEAQELFKKYNEGKASPKECIALEQWYHTEQAKQRLDEQEADFLSFKGELWNRTLVQAGLYENNIPEKNTVKLWPRYAGIAAAIIGLAIGVYFFTAPRHPELVSGSPNYANDIKPGGNRATLTMGNGKTINLNDDKAGVIFASNSLKYDDGTTIDPSLAKAISPQGGERVEGAIPNVTATTPRGGMYLFILPEGTKVWLNAESEIKFASQFTGKVRKVFLVGEAYFEVAKDAKRPFVVASAGQEVAVLGTHFNISAYKGEGIKTTLLEGSVRVTSLLSPPRGEPSPSRALRSKMSERQRGQDVILKPNQQSLVTANNNITVKQVKPGVAVAWKNGEFWFDDEPLESIMRRIARWYDVTVEYQGIDPTERFGGSVSRFSNVSKVLENLELTGGIHFKIEAKKIIVTK